MKGRVTFSLLCTTTVLDTPSNCIGGAWRLILTMDICIGENEHHWFRWSAHGGSGARVECGWHAPVNGLLQNGLLQNM